MAKAGRVVEAGEPYAACVLHRRITVPPSSNLLATIMAQVDGSGTATRMNAGSLTPVMKLALYDVGTLPKVGKIGIPYAPIVVPLSFAKSNRSAGDLSQNSR